VKTVARSSNRNQRPGKSVLLTVEYALGVLTAGLIAVILWVLSDGLALDRYRSDVIDVIPAVGTLMVAFVSVLLSYSALAEQRRARQAGTDPVILVHFGQRKDAPSMVTLEITNVGAGAAQNVVVALQNERVRQLLDEERITTNFSEISHPIRTIPQDRSVSYNFGVGFDLLKEPYPQPIEVKVSYDDIDGNAYTSAQVLDVLELRWQRADKPIDARIASAIEKLEKEVSKLASDRKRFFTVVQKVEDHREEKQADVARMRESIAATRPNPETE
jgi:hypothetical protein